MGRCNAAAFCAQAPEKRIADPAPAFLNSLGALLRKAPDIRAENPKLHMIPTAKGTDKLLIRFRFFPPKLMIDMGSNQGMPARNGAAHQKMGQRYGIRAPRKPNDNRAGIRKHIPLLHGGRNFSLDLLNIILHGG